MKGARRREHDIIILGAEGTGGDVLRWFPELAALAGSNPARVLRGGAVDR
jgi:hypothetical protein